MHPTDLLRAELLLDWQRELLPLLRHKHKCCVLAGATDAVSTMAYNAIQGKDPKTPVAPAPNGRCYAAYQSFATFDAAAEFANQFLQGELPVLPLRADESVFIVLAHGGGNSFVVRGVPCSLPEGMLRQPGIGKTYWMN